MTGISNNEIIIKIIDKTRKIELTNFLIVNPFTFPTSEDTNGEEKIVTIHPPPVTKPISVFVNPLYFKNTATYP